MLSKLDIRKLAHPLMQELAEFGQCLVSLGSRDRLSMIYIDAVSRFGGNHAESRHRCANSDRHHRHGQGVSDRGYRSASGTTSLSDPAGSWPT